MYNLSTCPRLSSHYQWPVRSQCPDSWAWVWLVCVRFLPSGECGQLESVSAVRAGHRDPGHAALQHGRWHPVNTNTGQTDRDKERAWGTRITKQYPYPHSLAFWVKVSVSYVVCVKRVCIFNQPITTEYSDETVINYHPSFAKVIMTRRQWWTAVTSCLLRD